MACCLVKPLGEVFAAEERLHPLQFPASLLPVEDNNAASVSTKP